MQMSKFLQADQLWARKVVLAQQLVDNSSPFLRLMKLSPIQRPLSRNPPIDLRHEVAPFGRAFARTVCAMVWGGWPLPKREGSSDQTDGDFDAAARLPLCLCATAHKDMSSPVPSQGGRIWRYSSLYGHDLTNVDISGGGSLVQLSRGDKDDTLWSGWSHCCSRRTAGQIHNWQCFHLRPA